MNKPIMTVWEKDADQPIMNVWEVADKKMFAVILRKDADQKKESLHSVRMTGAPPTAGQLLDAVSATLALLHYGPPVLSLEKLIHAGACNRGMWLIEHLYPDGIPLNAETARSIDIDEQLFFSWAVEVLLSTKYRKHIPYVGYLYTERDSDTSFGVNYYEVVAALFRAQYRESS